MLIITRTLIPQELGTWTLIGSLLIYGTVLDPIVSYWTTRNTARRIESGKTSILSSGVFSIGGIFIYIFLVFMIGPQTDANFDVLLFAILLVPFRYFMKVLSAINIGWKPEVTSYGLIISEIIKIPLLLIFIHFYDWGLIGLILGFMVAYAANITIQIIYARAKIKNKFKLEFLTKWIKLSWISLYPRIHQVLSASDVVIFSIITGSVVGVAYFAAARIIAELVTYAGNVNAGMYAKLLEQDKKEFLTKNIRLFFFFAIPFASIAIAFARPGLFALNPLYEIASLVVIFFTLTVFLKNITNIFSEILRGIEKVDLNPSATFKDYAKSNLFFVPTLRIIQNIVFLSSLAFVLFVLVTEVQNVLDLVIYWSIIALVTEIPLCFYLFRFINRRFKLTIDTGSIFKYLIISVIAFGSSYLLAEEYLIYSDEVIYFIPNLLIFVGFGIGVYTITTYIVDIKTRNLVSDIISYIRK